MAAGTVMPVDCILFVKVHSCCKVTNSFIVFQESIPYKTSAVISWSVLRIQLNNLVEVFESQVKSVAAYFLSYSAQMMNGLNIGWLQLNRLEVILLCLLQVACLVPAERPIVICFEMVWVKLDSLSVIVDSSIKITLFSVGKPSVVVKVSFARLYVNCCSKTFDCFVKVTSPVKRDAFVVVCVCVFGIDLDRCGVVLDCQAKLTKLVIRKPSIKECLKVIGVDLESFGVESDGCLIVTLLSCSISLSMESFSLSFQFGVELNVFHVKRLWNSGCFLCGREIVLIFVQLVLDLPCATLFRVGRFLCAVRAFLNTSS